MLRSDNAIDTAGRLPVIANVSPLAGIPMDDKQKTVRMWFENLFVLGGPNCDQRLALSALTSESHIHGGLRLEIQGRCVPHLGYGNPDDVCFGEWLQELFHASRALKSTPCRYVYDEGEQGQPAFVFEREGKSGYFSIVSSEISDGVSDAQWQRIEFCPQDFISAFQELEILFRRTLTEAAPKAAEQWISRLPSADATV